MKDKSIEIKSKPKEKRYLSVEEIRKLESTEYEIKLQQALLANLENRVEINKLEFKIKLLQNELLTRDIVEKKRLIVGRKGGLKQFDDELAIKYGIPKGETFRYNELTLEVNPSQENIEDTMP